MDVINQRQIKVLPVSSGFVESIHAFGEFTGQKIGVLVDVHGVGNISVQEALIVLGDLVLVVAEDFETQLLLVIALVGLLMGQLQWGKQNTRLVRTLAGCIIHMYYNITSALHIWM